VDEEVIGLSTSVVVSFCALRSPLLSLNFLEKMVLGVPTDLLQLLPFRRYRTAKKGPMSDVLNFKSYFNGLQFNIGPYAYFFLSKWTEVYPFHTHTRTHTHTTITLYTNTAKLGIINFLQKSIIVFLSKFDEQNP
jgi:hypothetical protein